MTAAPLIERVPGKCGGAAVIAGTRLTVAAIDSVRDSAAEYGQNERHEVLKLYPYLTSGAKVVISSSWRHGRDLSTLALMLRERGFVGEVIDKTPDWVTKVPGGLYSARERGDEIAAWLAEHPEVDGCVVLDDNSDMTAVRRYFVQTSFDGGLLDAHVDLALLRLAEPLNIRDRGA